MDFFTVEAVTCAGLVRFHVLFVIDLASRKVEVAGIVHQPQPHEAWMRQMARNLTDAVEGFLLGHRRPAQSLIAHARKERPPPSEGGGIGRRRRGWEGAAAGPGERRADGAAEIGVGAAAVSRESVGRTAAGLGLRNVRKSAVRMSVVGRFVLADGE